MIRTARALGVFAAIGASAGAFGCAGEAALGPVVASAAASGNTTNARNAPETTGAEVPSSLLPSDRDGVQMPGRVVATELPEDRGGEGNAFYGCGGQACGIVPEDRDRP